MEIRIVLPRFRWILLAAVLGGLFWSGTLSVRFPGQASLIDGLGGSDPSVIAGALRTVDRERVKQAVLERREEILRYQLLLLEEETRQNNNPNDVEKLRAARENLLAIIRERTASEHILLQSLQELWDAEGTLSTTEHVASPVALVWPIAPRKGISARFDDDGYEKRFGFAHHAIDIPASPGTVIQAPAEGTVQTVAMNGMGYSFVVIRHADGMETIYGHIRRSLVAEGQLVRVGDAIAETGGVPGEPGTGPYSTGPHLHFAVRINGVLVDPMRYLVQ